MKFEQAPKERVSTKRHLQYHRIPSFLGTEDKEEIKKYVINNLENLVEPHEQIARSEVQTPRAGRHNGLLVAILILQIIHLLLNFYVWYSMACSICIDYLIGG